MNKILTENIDKIEEACVEHHVESLFAFGSVCTDKFHENSDIDLLVAFKPMEAGDYSDNYFQVSEVFENIFQRSVDLVTNKSLKNPYFIDSLNKTKTLLYAH